MTALRSGRAIWRSWLSQALEDRDRRRDKREAWLLLAATAFVFSNGAAYSLRAAGSLQWAHLYAPLLWLLVIGLAHLVLRTLRPRRDPLLLPAFALLTGWGLLLQDRLAPNFLGRQTLWFSLATLALLAVTIAPRTLQPLRRYRYVILLGGLVLLAITLAFGVNPSGSGAALWLPVPFPFLGPVYFQPSEFLKLVLVVFLASYFTEQEPLHRYRRRARAGRPAARDLAGAFRRHLPFLGPLLLMWGFTLLLLVWQRDLGAAALFFIVFVGLVYLATGERLYVFSGLVLLLLAGAIAFFAFDTVVAGRVLSWINPWPDASDRAYQIVQALYAQAAGGVFGQGIGQGFPDYIPVVHSDFALAALAEEWGLIGSLTVVACYALLAIRGLRVALHTVRGPRPNFFHTYLAAGLVTLISVQAVLIMGGITRLLPLTGITLPLVSYGGSSLLVTSLAIGLLLWLSAAAEPVPLMPPADRLLARRIVRLGAAFLIVFFVVALALTYWGVVRAEALAGRLDNPRLVEAERRLNRGRIVAHDGAILAESIGPPDNLTRHYPLATSGPAVGYHSLRFGAAGIEGALDAHLRGQSNAFWPEAWRRLSHVPVTGGDVRLTLDAGLQDTATTLLAGPGVAGGLVLLELTTRDGLPVADVRAMVSLPGYDPNHIDEEFETLAKGDPGPLVNRAAQGLYQPGLIVQPFITAAAIDAGALALDDPLDDPHQPVTLNGQVLRCVTPRETGGVAYTWANMAALRCPAPLQALGNRLGAATLDNIFKRFGLHSAPALPIPAEGSAATITDAGLAAIGQEALTLTPLQAALATSALASDGRPPAPRLVEALATAGGDWRTQPAGAPAAAGPAVDPAVAAAVRAGWPASDDVAGFGVTALSGPQNSRTTWFLGFAPAGNPRFVVALALEEVADVAAAEAIGRAVLTEAMAP